MRRLNLRVSHALQGPMQVATGILHVLHALEDRIKLRLVKLHVLIAILGPSLMYWVRYPALRVSHALQGPMQVAMGMLLPLSSSLAWTPCSCLSMAVRHEK